MAGFRDRVSLLSRDQGGQGGHSPHSADAQPAARQILPNKPNYAGAIASMTAINALIDSTSFPSIATGGFTACYPLYLLFLVTAWGLYVLLRPVNKNLALLFLLLNTVGVAIQCASMFPLLSALLTGDAGSHMQAYSAAQLEGLSYLSINVYKTGFVTAQLFFGTWLFPLGYLIYKSGYLPRFLGALLLLDGIAVLIWFFQALVLPDNPAIHSPGLVVSLVAEVGLTLWLLVMGVKVVDSEAPSLVDPSPAS